MESVPNTSKSVRRVDNDFEEELLKCYNDCGSDDSDSDLSKLEQSDHDTDKQILVR